MPMTVLATAANAVLPILFLMGLGYLLRRINFLDENIIKAGNKIVFSILLPVMLMVNVYEIPDIYSINWTLVIYCILAIVVLFALGFGVAMALTNKAAYRGVLWQSIFCSNFVIVGIPLAEALAGADGAGTAAAITAFVLPVMNGLAVVSLAVFDTKLDQFSINREILVGKVLKNPLIIGGLGGIFLLLLRQMQVLLWGEVVFSLKYTLTPVYTTLTYLKGITSPFSLLLLGGSFVFSSLKTLAKEVALSTVVRLLLAPAIGIGGAYLLSIYSPSILWTPGEYAAMVALFATPVAVSSGVMARQMHGDYQLATQLVVWHSLMSIVTVFVQVCIMLSAGLM